MARDVTIVDYGMGNLLSLSRALERAGAGVRVSADAAEIGRASRLVIPGQGAFGQAMRQLGALGLVDPIKDAILGGRPVLGVCLGLQILFETSAEAPGVTGLGVLPGRVDILPSGGELKRPHMGWSPVAYGGTHPVLSAGGPLEPYYFVHSYAVRAEPMAGVEIASAEHGVCFVAALAKGSLLATQFHPEKSQQAGARLLEAWIQLE